MSHEQPYSDLAEMMYFADSRSMDMADGVVAISSVLWTMRRCADVRATSPIASESAPPMESAVVSRLLNESYVMGPKPSTRFLWPFGERVTSELIFHGHPLPPSGWFFERSRQHEPPSTICLQLTSRQR